MDALARKPPKLMFFGLLTLHTLAMEELSRASGSIAFSYGAHSNSCVN